MSLESITISVISIGADTTLEVRIAGWEDVTALKERTAELTGFHVKRIVLTSGSQQLDEGMTVGSVLRQGAVVTVVKKPCNASNYADSINFKQEECKPHFKRVGEIGYTHSWDEYYKAKEPVTFPEPKGVNVNMMPFIAGDLTTLPENVRQYWKIIHRCLLDINAVEQEEQAERVFYLTIHEGEVEAGKTQRRPGVHVDRPSSDVKGVGGYQQYQWGSMDGIYLASTVPKSTKVWNCTVDPELIGDLGSLEHCREELGEGEEVGAGELIWITDLTPHEAIPLQSTQYRQFFRLVTSQVSHWYAQDSTPNPLGVVPDSDITTIVQESKFEAFAAARAAPPASTMASAEPAPTVPESEAGMPAASAYEAPKQLHASCSVESDKAAGIMPLAELQDAQIWRAKGVNPATRELHLSDDEFQCIFGMKKEDFLKLPAWKRNEHKKKHKLF